MEDFDMNKEYTNEDFDRMLVPLHDANGHPYLDEYEYIDAQYTNDEVERLRYVYFQKKKERKKSKLSDSISIA